MSNRVSVKGIARDAARVDTAARAAVVASMSGLPAAKRGKKEFVANDSFVNLAQKMGVGADNPLSTSSYGFNPITRNRNLLEWIHRGSWLGGVAIELAPDDMTRAGIEYLSEMDAGDTSKLDQAITKAALWPSFNAGLKWGNLYGGSLVIALIDGQDMRSPLRIETVKKGQFKGFLVLDRWMVDPTLEDLVTELGPDLGLPKYYRVQTNAPALRGQAVHYSRVMLRHVGVELPYQQALIENLWGMSILERMWDRMIAYDSASTGMAQLIYKSYLRTLKVKDFRNLVAQGGKPLEGFLAYANMMRKYQNAEGVTVIDADDEMEVQQHQAMSGMKDALESIGEQVAGALRTPLVRLFGRSPGGLNATGESDIRLYYDHINQEQMRVMHRGVTAGYRLVAANEGITLGDEFSLGFRSLWEPNDSEKATNAKTFTDTVIAAVEANLVGQQTALKELRSQSRRTGVFANITEEQINAADDTIGPPPGMGGEDDEEGDVFGGAPEGMNDGPTRTQDHVAPLGRKQRRRAFVSRAPAASCQACAGAH